MVTAWLKLWSSTVRDFDFQAITEEDSLSSGSPRTASPSSPLLTRQDPPPPPAVLRERDADIPREVWTESQVLDMLEQEVRTAVKTIQNLST